jgi:hypothetical protein
VFGFNLQDARDRLVLLNSILNQQVRLKVTAGNARAV